MVQTAKEALDECIKLDPRRNWITTEKQQYCIHSEGEPSRITMYSAWCSLPNEVDQGERFESYSWDAVIDEARNSLCAGKSQESPAEVAP